VSRKTAILKWYAQAKRGKVKCELHPLIHTLLEFKLIQDVEIKKAVPKNSAFSEFKPRYCSLG
jgi:hypothetical protein